MVQRKTCKFYWYNSTVYLDRLKKESSYYKETHWEWASTGKYCGKVKVHEYIPHNKVTSSGQLADQEHWACICNFGMFKKK
jgi:hypothetical protein